MSAKEKSKSKPPVDERQKQIDRLEKDVEDLRSMAGDEAADTELQRIRSQVSELRREFYTHLGPWQRAQIARHQQRPYLLDFVSFLFTDFIELHGDRNFGDDKAIICGLAKFHGRPVAVIGQQKGRDTKQRLLRNFGQPKPEGYRKALRVMQLAAKFGRPIFTFIDTPGAYPGLDAEERGQAEAIARNLREMSRLPVPIISTVTGEGGSGGALAIAIADYVNVLENSFYSVISPEGCAAIMWRDATQAETAASALKITATDLKEMGIIDEIVPEPEGGAHTDHEGSARLLEEILERQLAALTNQSTKQLLDARYDKYRHMAQFFDLGS
ncbi:MAG: acetyl-CoA carboxylase carboxyltransferase subunit alpha [Candidatus Acidiferrum sp.]